LKYFS